MTLVKSRTEYLAALEVILKDIVGYESTPDGDYGLMLFYQLGWENHSQPDFVAGKRTRPFVTMLCAAATGGDWQQALSFAAGVELIHNFSLVHDDIQDGSPLRHARATVWSLWGKDQAINAGDALFAYAHLAMQHATTLSAELRARAIHVLDAACISLTRGQQLDMAYEGRDSISVDEYLHMVSGKTAALLATAAELGAIAADAESDVCANYREFGQQLGLAFQIRDDLLGIWGDSSVTGKSSQTDIKKRKKTLPIVYALEKMPELAAAYVPPDRGGASTDTIVRLLQDCAARAFTETEERLHAERALAALEAAAPQGQAGDNLRELTYQLLGRSN